MPAPRFPLLIIDSAARRPWVGLKRADDRLDEDSSPDDASRSLFPMIAKLLRRNEVRLDQLAGIAVCAGPGSMLSIRTAIAGVRAWRGAGLIEGCVLHEYNALAAGSRMSPASQEPVRWIVTDARRQSWNALRATGSRRAEPEILENAALEEIADPIFALQDFPIWTKTSAELIPLPYLPETLFVDAFHLDLFTPVAELEPLVLRPAEYAKWQPPA